MSQLPRATPASVFRNDVLKGKVRQLVASNRQEATAAQVALITGGGTGIGFEIARQFGLHGARVCIMGRRPDVLDDAVAVLRSAGIHATKVVGDVRDERSCTAAVQHTMRAFGGSLDILINAAAGNFLVKAEDLNLKGFKTVIEIDTYGVFNMCRVCFEHLKASKGVVVNISMTLHYGATWFQLHACAAKAAIDSMTRNLALEWGRYGIRVNGLAPGPIADTAGLTKLAPAMANKLDKAISRHVPLGRLGTKTEMAMSCVFLVSDAASYINGCILVADGGHWLYSEPMADPENLSKTSRSLEQTGKDVGRPVLSKL